MNGPRDLNDVAIDDAASPISRHAAQPQSTDTGRSPMTPPDLLPTHDVIVMGGGLAGLTLALQLKAKLADLAIVVVERRTHPVPEAAHKVGESSVEIGAHYFADVLGLKDHLDTKQLKKFGFRFFFSEGRRDIDQVTEIGASRPLAATSYQIDRGIFENFLAEEAQRRGITFVDGARVKSIAMANAPLPTVANCDNATPARALASHGITYARADEPPVELRARWLIDAAGRAGLLKKKLGLARPNAHDCNAVWFRISDRITLDDWTDNAEWRASCNPPARWLSTNHLVGAGYWVWLIPLASGSHSIGIVADPKLHPLDRIDTFEKAMDWLAIYQPRLFDALDGKREKLQDFAFFKHFSYGCGTVFSADRWALTGEAGLFLDPFYSPGSDFIGIGNTFITELVARDRAGRSIGVQAQLFDQIYHSFYESTLALYTDQYPIFGDAEVLPVKVLWDYTYYWGVLSQFFFQGRLTNLSMFAALRGELAHCQALNIAVQRFFREWSAVSEKRNPAVMLDQAALPWFARLNASLHDTHDDASFRTRIREATAQLRALSASIVEHARRDHRDLDATSIEALLGDATMSRLDAGLHAEDRPVLFAVTPDVASATPRGEIAAAMV